MLTRIAEGVRVHESATIQSNAVIVDGPSGVLLVDPGLTTDELAGIARDLHESGDAVVAGFATHPDWDHVLWHADLGDAPRYGTARCAAAMRELLADPAWRDRVARVLPPEIAEEVPLELLGLITGLPDGATRVPWDGPETRIIEHRGHAAGHAALLIAERGVLVAGDMLSDVLVPILDGDADDPIGDYLSGLDVIEDAAASVDVVVPGHGSVGDAAELRTRIARDRAYVLALRDGGPFDDPRIGPAAKPGWEWVADLHAWQADSFARRGAGDVKH